MTVFCPDIVADYSLSLCTSIDLYCERLKPEPDSELINVFSCLAFPVSAAGAFFYWQQQRNARDNAVILALLVIMVLIGAGSAMFHVVATVWAQWADVLPIIVFMVFYFWLVLYRFFDLPAWATLGILSAFLALTLFLEFGMPRELFWGGAMYIPSLVAIAASAAAMIPRWPLAGKKMLVAAAVFGAAYLFRSVDMIVCPAFPIGTHFLWHILVSAVMFLLVRLYVRHVPQPAVPIWQTYR